MSSPTHATTRSRRWLVACVAIALPWCACDVVYINYANSSGIATVRTLELSASDISGWKMQQGETYKVLVGDEWFGYIDGGAPDYLNNGMIEGGVQKMSGASRQTGEMWVMDFGDAQNAEKMFADKKAQISDARELPSFDPNIAIFDNGVSDGGTTYGHFKNFYFAISLSGFDDKLQAGQSADLFLRVYQAKMKN
jgi:hypothetical protein